MDDASDEGLGLAYGASGYGSEAIAGGGLKVEQRRARALPPSGGPGVAPYDAIALASGVKLQFDAHRALALVDQLLGACARPAPDGPRYGVQERGLAVAVLPRQARDVYGLEVQGGGIFPVADEVPEG